MILIMHFHNENEYHVMIYPFFKFIQIFSQQLINLECHHQILQRIMLPSFLDFLQQLIFSIESSFLALFFLSLSIHLLNQLLLVKPLWYWHSIYLFPLLLDYYKLVLMQVLHTSLPFEFPIVI